MYTRRVCLGTATTFLGVALAGCFGGSDEGARAFEAAMEQLHDNEQDFTPYLRAGEPSPDFVGDVIRDRAREAERYLDDAATHWSEEDQPYIESARTVALLHRAVADAGESQLAYQDCVQETAEYWHQEQFEPARDHIETCGDDLAGLAGAVTAMKSTGGADTDLLKEVEAPLEFYAFSQFPLDSGTITALEAFHDGFDWFIEGSVDGHEGRQAWHQTDWETALDHLEPAANMFEMADQSFVSIESNVTLPDTIEHFRTEFSCYVENHLEATELFIESAEAGRRGDSDTAEEKGRLAMRALEPC